jgi:hypothetical protein
LLVHAGCTLKPEWNAYYCPPFPEGYAQVVLLDLTGIPNNIDSNGVDRTPPSGKTIRSTWYQIGSTASYGASGNPQSCDLGSRGCQQYQINLRPRHAYAVRQNIMGFPKATPSSLSVRWTAMGPGDWMVVAIPYPASALPFTVKSGTKVLTSVNSYDLLNATAYYWDTTTQHLYLMTIGTAKDVTYTSKWVLLTKLNRFNCNRVSQFQVQLLLL